VTEPKTQYNEIYQTLQAAFVSVADDYQRLNALRNTLNQTYPDFDLYLEDVWNDNTPGETHFEYILRSKVTYNETERIGYDVYQNHQDLNKVWHLDDYTHTVVLIDTVEPLAKFMFENSK
jgi:hypothetical protein